MVFFLSLQAKDGNLHFVNFLVHFIKIYYISIIEYGSALFVTMFFFLSSLLSCRSCALTTVSFSIFTKIITQRRVPCFIFSYVVVVVCQFYCLVVYDIYKYIYFHFFHLERSNKMRRIKKKKKLRHLTRHFIIVIMHNM